MAKIHSDEFGVYVRANGAIHRPGSSIKALCDRYNIDIKDFTRSPLPQLTMVTRHVAGSSGVPVKNVDATPYVNVDGEYWVSDGITSYSDWDRERALETLAYYKVCKRIRMGERIAQGQEWRDAHAEELKKILKDREVKVTR